MNGCASRTSPSTFLTYLLNGCGVLPGLACKRSHRSIMNVSRFGSVSTQLSQLAAFNGLHPPAGRVGRICVWGISSPRVSSMSKPQACRSALLHDALEQALIIGRGGHCFHTEICVKPSLFPRDQCRVMGANGFSVQVLIIYPLPMRQARIVQQLVKASAVRVRGDGGTGDFTERGQDIAEVDERRAVRPVCLTINGTRTPVSVIVALPPGTIRSR